MERSYLLLAPAAFSRIQTQFVDSTEFYSSKRDRMGFLVFTTKNNNLLGLEYLNVAALCSGVFKNVVMCSEKGHVFL